MTHMKNMTAATITLIALTGAAFAQSATSVQSPEPAAEARNATGQVNTGETTMEPADEVLTDGRSSATIDQEKLEVTTFDEDKPEDTSAVKNP